MSTLRGNSKHRCWGIICLAAGVLWTAGASPVGAAVQKNGAPFAASACGLLITEESASPGDVFKLTANETCEADGVLIDASGTQAQPITFDMNGFSLASAKNVEGAGNVTGVDGENHGVAVGGNWVIVTNSNTSACSKVEFFTSNFDIGGDNVTVEGGLSGTCNPGGTVPANTYNLMGGVAFGGGVLAVDRAQRVTVRRVLLYDPVFVTCAPGFNPATSPTPCEDPTDENIGAGAGDLGIDWKRCTGPAGLVENSYIHSKVGGMRFRNCKSGNGSYTFTNGATTPPDDITRPFGFVVRYNTIIGSDLTGVEITRDVENALLYGNHIAAQGAGGVGVELRGGNRTKNIAIVDQVPVGTGSVVTPADGCDIDISAGATGILVINTATLSGTTFTYTGGPAFFSSGPAPATCVQVP